MISALENDNLLSVWNNLLLIEWSLDDNVIRGGSTAGTTSNPVGNPAASVQFPHSATAGEVKRYTVSIEIEGLSIYFMDVPGPLHSG